MTNPFSIGLSAEDLEQFLLCWYNEVSSLYWTYDSLTLTKKFQEAWNDWVKRHRPDIYEKEMSINNKEVR